jgi:hypothetical protein
MQHLPEPVQRSSQQSSSTVQGPSPGSLQQTPEDEHRSVQHSLSFEHWSGVTQQEPAAVQGPTQHPPPEQGSPSPPQHTLEGSSVSQHVPGTVGSFTSPLGMHPHTPASQKPPSHSFDSSHAWPSGQRMHLFCKHVLPPQQSSSWAQRKAGGEQLHTPSSHLFVQQWLDESDAFPAGTQSQ